MLDTCTLGSVMTVFSNEISRLRIINGKTKGINKENCKTPIYTI